MTMSRLSLNQADVDRHRSQLQSNYPDNEAVCPPSNLKLDDDVQWLGFVNGRVLWGYETPDFFHIYAPDIFGDVAVPVEVGYVNDRAPADPQEDALPIFPPEPQQQFAQQPGVREAQKGKQRTKTPDKHEVREAIKGLLARLPDDATRKRVRKYIQQHRSDIELPEG